VEVEDRKWSITEDTTHQNAKKAQKSLEIGERENNEDSKKETHPQIHPVMQPPVRDSNFCTNTIRATGKIGMHNGERELHDIVVR